MTMTDIDLSIHLYIDDKSDATARRIGILRTVITIITYGMQYF